MPNFSRLELEPLAADLDLARDFVIEDLDRLPPVISRFLFVQNEGAEQAAVFECPKHIEGDEKGCLAYLSAFQDDKRSNAAVESFLQFVKRVALAAEKLKRYQSVILTLHLEPGTEHQEPLPRKRSDLRKRRQRELVLVGNVTPLPSFARPGHQAGYLTARRSCEPLTPGPLVRFTRSNE